MAKKPIDRLREELQDPQFAKFYGADQAKVRLALTMVATRQKLGLTQRELAQKSGVSQPYIAKLERGYANPTLGRIGALLALMGRRLVTTTDSLLPEEPIIEEHITSDAASTSILLVGQQMPSSAGPKETSDESTVAVGLRAAATTA